MTIAVDMGRKATKTNNVKIFEKLLSGGLKFRSVYIGYYKYKQCGPRSDCSYIYTIC